MILFPNKYQGNVLSLRMPLLIEPGAFPFGDSVGTVQELKQKSSRENFPRALIFMVRPERFEPPTYGLEVRCSIQLSYGRKQKGLLPNLIEIVHKKIQSIFFMDNILLLTTS